MVDLMSLAERCEQASGPDRELDGAIQLALDPLAHSVTNAGVFSASGYRVGALPAYTASLDAAMTLVPEHFSGQMWLRFNEGRTNPPRAALWSHDDGNMVRSRFNAEASAATPALALCAIALRARSRTDG